MFYLTNGLYYIANNNGQWQPVSKRELASKWDTEAKAQHVVQTLPGILKTRGYHVETAESEDEFSSAPPKAKSFSCKLPPLQKCGVAEIELMYKKITSALASISDVPLMIKSCEEGLAQQNDIQEDLLHEMEFLSGARGQAAHMSAEMKRCRRKRRAYKDMLLLLNSVSGMHQIPDGYLEAWQKKTGNRKYTPRARELPISFGKNIE